MSDGTNYDLNKYVREKIKKLEASDRDLRSVFLLMTGEPEKLFAETNDGYAITKITYGQFRERTEAIAGSLKTMLGDLEKGSMVGLYMNNCEEWLEIFWGLLMDGYRPLLVNTRMSKAILEDIVKTYEVKAVISDGKELGDNTIMLDALMQQVKSGKSPKTEAENKEWADELILMSSGTTSHVKLCIYNGETMYYQICDSARIIQENKQTKQHYEGELKQLAFLPFYHVFGLVAVHVWFGFFCRSFVFLKDFSSETILNTVRRHKVTHIFSIPLLWDTIYNTVVRTAKERGEYEKLMKGIRISEKLSGIPFLSKLFTKVAFASVREQIFGDSIKFTITGGSAISPDVLRFFNAIGYNLADGYGMTEVGITSVELSTKRKFLTDRSVGKPFYSVDYKISPDGELLVKGETMADIVMEGGVVVDRTEEGWFHTNDLAEEKNGRFYILGRKDDVIIGPSGENINPDILEDKIRIPGAESLCIARMTAASGKVPVLLIKVSPYASSEVLKGIVENAKRNLEELTLSSVIGKVILTTDPLMEPDDFKFNRRRISEKLDAGEFTLSDPDNVKVTASELTMKVAEIIGKIVGKTTSEVSPDADLFFDLGGTSLDYFSIILELQKEFGVSFPNDTEKSFKSAGEFAAYIEENR